MAAAAGTYFTVGQIKIRDKFLSSAQQKKTSSFAVCRFMAKIPYCKKRFDIYAKLLIVSIILLGP